MATTKTQYIVTAYIRDKKGRILSIGKNSYIKTHPRMVKLGKQVGYHNHEKRFIHAEIDAINKCPNLDRAHSIEIFVYSERSKEYRESSPCPICSLAIGLTDIKVIQYQDQEGKRTLKTVKSSVKETETKNSY